MRRAKYGSRKATVGGEPFDSRREARRWIGLVRAEREGRISCLRRQVPYVLVPAQREPPTFTKAGKEKPGKLIERPVRYVADFVYLENGTEVVEDCKGVRTKEYVIKRKLMLFLKGIRIRET